MLQEISNQIQQWLPFTIDTELAAMVSAILVFLVAGIYLATAFGVRWGSIVWTGYRPGRLLPDKRLKSLIYGLGLLLSAVGIAVISGVIEMGIISAGLYQSIGFAVGAFLLASGVLSLAKGSTWERMFFAPSLLLGSFVAFYVTFL